jgi:hypothetical protein
MKTRVFRAKRHKVFPKHPNMILDLHPFWIWSVGPCWGGGCGALFLRSLVLPFFFLKCYKIAAHKKKQKEENKLKAGPRNAYVSSQQVLIL